jgi:uncharacterized protein YjbI with pentapeptide repeats
MKQLASVALVIVALLVAAVPVAAVDPVGVDCTSPPNLVPGADLRNCDLSGREMEGVNLTNADLTGANLDDASLFTATVRGAKFDGASLRRTNMEDADAIGASFVGADMRNVDLYFALVRNANISGADLSDSWLNGIDFEGSIAQGANFSGSDIRSVDFKDTDLRGADLSFTDLLYSPMQRADLRDANLFRASQFGDDLLVDITWGNTTCADGTNSDDADGDGFTCLNNFPANVPPAVTLTSPADGTTVDKGETVTIGATASDSDGVVIRVEFYAGATKVGIDGTVPYSVDWTPTVAGTYPITARAFDDDNAAATTAPVTVNVLPEANNQPPTAVITSPKNGATVYRFWGANFDATASDPDGVVVKVEFYSGTTLLSTDTHAPYTHAFRPTTKGHETLTVKAYDDDGAVTTSAPITVRVR